jgi:hypothetical protein
MKDSINVNGTTIMWDVPVIIDRTILVNRPDIALHDTEKDKTCLLIDIAMIQTLTKQLKN